MSLSEQLQRVNGGQIAALKALIQKYGGTVPEGTKIDGYANIINGLGIYSQQEMLSDTTKTALGLPNTAVPDDALLKLGSIVVGGKVIQHTIVNQYTATEDNQSISIPLSGFSGSYSIDFRSTQSPEFFDISLRNENNQLDNQAQRTAISNYNNTVSSITGAINETNTCIPLFNFIVAGGAYFSAIVHLLNINYAYLQLWKSNRALFDSLLIVLKHTGDTVTIYKNNEVIP